MSCDEEMLLKCGKELFREVLRAYPEAEYEDYFKNGAWKDDQMRIDVQLYLAHRSEAGAPEPLALEDVKLPDIPVFQMAKLTGLTQPLGLPNLVKPTLSSLAAKTGTTTLSGAASDLREMAMFVSKYKLDPSKAKTTLMVLSSARRKYVITNFASESTGADCLTELEKYVKHCEESKAWGDEPEQEATPVTGATTATISVPTVRPGIAVRPVIAPSLLKPAAGGPPPALTPGGVKRPIVASQTLEANKTPRLSIGSAAAPGLIRSAGAPVPRPVGVAITRPHSVGLLRPQQQNGQWGQKW